MKTRCVIWNDVLAAILAAMLGVVAIAAATDSVNGDGEEVVWEGGAL